MVIFLGLDLGRAGVKRIGKKKLAWPPAKSANGQRLRASDIRLHVTPPPSHEGLFLRSITIHEAEH
jgi:hypothetical protein